MIKLDDFLSKKKEPAQVLDLSKVKITSKEEFKKYLDKIPECKVKSEKLLPDQIKIKDKDFTFVPSKREEKHLKEWNYLDPTPPDMKGVKLEDLCTVNIDWKMLTTVRPKLKVEEDMFSRLVQLGKLELKYQQLLNREKMTDWVRRTKNPKSSIIEMRIISCKECGEDFCDGSVCSKLTYENFFRPQPTTSNPGKNLLLASESEGKKVKKKKKKKRKQKKRKKSRSKGRRNKLGKTSIFNRPASTGCTRNHFRAPPEVVSKFQPRSLSSTRSTSYERKRSRILSEGRSKSAPRINFERNILGAGFKRQDYISDSAPSNTDYSTQSDSESPDFHQKFMSPRLKLSGKRKLLSARVSFAERQQRRESADTSRLKFIRQCTLNKDCAAASFRRYKGSRSSDSSTSRSVSKSPFKNPLKLPFSTKQPSTVQIQFNDFLFPLESQFPDKIVLPITARMSKIKQNHGLQRKKVNISKYPENSAKIDSEFDKLATKKSEAGNQFCQSQTISSDSCLKGKGLFGKKVD